MTCDEYERRVIELFQSGKATPEQWREMAQCILEYSENEVKGDSRVAAIDAVCFPEDERLKQ